MNSKPFERQKAKSKKQKAGKRKNDYGQNHLKSKKQTAKGKKQKDKGKIILGQNDWRDNMESAPSDTGGSPEESF